MINESKYGGGIEHWDGKRISGSVYSESDPNAILSLDVVINNKHIEILSVGNYNEDRHETNNGKGRHAFVSSDLTGHLNWDSSLDIIQIFLSQTDITIHRPVFLKSGKEIKLKCFFPWTTLNVRTTGEVYPCVSRAWFKESAGVVGNQRHMPLHEIWNASPIQKVRKDFTEGNYNICREDICPFLNDEFHSKPPSSSVIAAMRHPDEPINIGVEELVHEIDEGCNLTCVMCRPKKIKVDVALGHKVADEIEVMAKKGDMKQLRISPAGEALIHPGVVRLLKSHTLSENGVHVTIMTNLTSITPALWNAIKHNDLTIQGSLDGATKETYEKIRVGAQWETAYKNLLFFVDAFKKGEMREFIVNTVLMGSNRYDLHGLIELTNKLGIKLFFIKHEGLSAIEENIFDCCKIDILDEIYEEMEKNNAFELAHVHFGSAVIILGKSYRSLEFRMTCAELQISRYNRRDIAARIVRECLTDIQSGTLKVSEDQFQRYAFFMKRTLGLINWYIFLIKKLLKLKNCSY